jgi:hypothetical protein
MIPVFIPPVIIQAPSNVQIRLLIKSINHLTSHASLILISSASDEYNRQTQIYQRSTRVRKQRSEILVKPQQFSVRKLLASSFRFFSICIRGQKKPREAYQNYDSRTTSACNLDVAQFTFKIQFDIHTRCSRHF